jgi:hypothetical protein
LCCPTVLAVRTTSIRTRRPPEPPRQSAGQPASPLSIRPRGRCLFKLERPKKWPESSCRFPCQQVSLSSSQLRPPAPILISNQAVKSSPALAGNRWETCAGSVFMRAPSVWRRTHDNIVPNPNPNHPPVCVCQACAFAGDELSATASCKRDDDTPHDNDRASHQNDWISCVGGGGGPSRNESQMRRHCITAALVQGN